MDDIIRQGLTSSRKYIDFSYHWNEEGSRLHDKKIEESHWFYNHRYEVKILQSFLKDILKHMDNYTMLVDLGCGNASKTRMFLDQMLNNNESLIYAPVDISGAHLEKTALKIMKEYKGRSIDVRPYACDNLEAIQSIRNFPQRKLIVWFAGLLSFSYDEQIRILGRMSNDLNTDDRLFLTVDGTDPNKKRQIELAYLDPDGYTGRYHTNAVQRLNTEYDGNIDVSKFDYKINFVAKRSRDSCSFIEKWMEALEKCDFYIGGFNLELKMEKGDKIFFHKNEEYSCKYTVDQLTRICEKGNFKVVDYWKNEHIIAMLLQKK